MKGFAWFMIPLMLLAACRLGPSDEIRMKQLRLLLVEAAAMAAMPQKEAREKAAVFARRAMSGPEMNAMHHGGEVSPEMKKTHALGDAVFALLETSAEGPDVELWRSRLLLASQAAWLRLTGSMQADALGRFTYSEGRQLAASQFMQEAAGKPDKTTPRSPYAQAAAQLVDKLNAIATRF